MVAMALQQAGIMGGNNQSGALAQALLQSGRETRVPRNARHRSLLAGKCLNPAGALYTPTYTVKNKTTHYRYYFFKATGHRIKGQDLETLVVYVLRALSNAPKNWHACWRSGANSIMAEEAQHRWQQIWDRWPDLDSKIQMRVAQASISRIIISDDTLTIRLNYADIIKVVTELEVVGGDTLGAVGDAGLIPDVAIRDNHLEITVAAHFETYGRNQIAVNAQGKPVHIIKRTDHNQTLVNALVKSYRWNRMLDRGKTSITELAAEAGLGRTYVSRIVSLILLAPDIVTAIMSGTQPATLQMQDLMENLPIEWSQQRAILFF